MSLFIIIIPLCISMNNGSVITMNTNILSNEGFDAALWKAQYKKFKRNNPRISMVPDLERKVLQKGMYRETVRKTLGLPEQIKKNADLYDLGASAFGIDYENYVIEYDHDNKVVRFYIVRG